MSEKLPKEKVTVFDHFVKAFSLALTNSTLYPHNHPAFNSSMESFKHALDRWFAVETKLEMGISSDNLLLHGAFVREESDLYSNVADYLHRKGLTGILFKRGIEMPELVKFFTFLKNDSKVILKKGGIVKNIGEMPHMIIKELDYSSFLTSAKASAAMDEDSIWQELSSIGKELKKGELPKSKAEFMTGFLRDPKKAAVVLNKIYKESLAKLDERSAAEEIKTLFLEISKYSGKHPGAARDNAKKELANIVSSLDPELVVSLLRDEGISDGLSVLADDLFMDSSDDMIANFMASLMNNGSKVNEKMIKLFNRLVSGRGKSDAVLPMMADKLLNEKVSGPAALSAIQNSIKDLFGKHPEDGFIAQIYDLTVGAFADRERGAKQASTRYSALIDEYKEFLKEDNLKREKIRLLLNILWLESDPARFKKMSGILAGSFAHILDHKNIKNVREAFELFVEELSSTQMSDPTIASAVKETLGKISERETINKLVSFIPGAACETMDDIAYMLVSAKQKDIMLEIVKQETNEESKKRMLEAILKTRDAGIVKQLFDDPIHKGVFSRNRYLLDLVTLCGALKVEEATECLKRVLEHRSFIATRLARELRVQSVFSLGRIGTPEAMELIRKVASDTDKSVRAVCKMVLESGGKPAKEVN